MRSIHPLRFALTLAFLIASPAFSDISQEQRNRIDQVTGAKGTYTAAEDVYRVNFPRTDVNVSVEGRPMHPFLGLTSWAAFTPHSASELMVMGDLVLFEDEVNPVMSAALDNGLEVTALHNHFFFDSPRVMFMHIGGSGSADRLASAVARALQKLKEIRKANPQPAANFGGSAIPTDSSITASGIDKILGVKGQENAGMYKASIGRKATMHGNPSAIRWASTPGLPLPAPTPTLSSMAISPCSNRSCSLSSKPFVPPASTSSPSTII